MTVARSVLLYPYQLTTNRTNSIMGKMTASEFLNRGLQFVSRDVIEFEGEEYTLTGEAATRANSMADSPGADEVLVVSAVALGRPPQVGQEIEVGHNGSKLLGDEFIGYSTVTVEAIGPDWVVVRRRGVSYTASFGKNKDILKLLME